MRTSCSRPGLSLFCSIALLSSACTAETVFQSRQHDFRVEVVMEGLDHPWGMVFLDGDALLITEKTGQLRLVRDWQLLAQPITGLPDIRQIGQGGLLGIALHPDFDNNRLVYLSYAGRQGNNYGTEVVRGQLHDSSLTNVETVFTALPKATGGRHFGSRLVFGHDGSLYISLGDRGADPDLQQRHPSQQIENHLGSLIRINDDGSIPVDNPFVSRSDARPEIYTWGNRNMQGMMLHPVTGEIWTHEHGPQGGDEINIMRPGINYGWPIITYGANYGTGTKIGAGTHHPDMAQPVYKWVPSIAPSGMMYYTGNRFPKWRDNIFVGSLKFQVLVRLETDGDTIIAEERLVDSAYGRIRDVIQGPDGLIYLLTDDANGKLLRLVPME